MNLEDLRYFINAADCGSLSSAARKIGVQKSTLSRRIGALEASLGLVLIDRSRRNFTLTSAGEHLHERGASVVRDAEQAEQALLQAFSSANDAAPVGEQPDSPDISPPAPAPATTEVTGRRQDVVQSYVLRNLRAKTITSGDKLPSERDLASSLGVSRQAVREAIRSLEMSGVLRLARGASGGAFVREMGADGITYSIRNLLILGDLPLNDVLELRAVVFGLAARFAAERGTRDDFRLIEENIKLLAHNNQIYPQATSIRISTGIYRLAARASRNRLLSALVDSLADIMEEMLAHMQSWPMMQEGQCARQEAFDAMCAGDGAAAERIIRDHCTETNLVLLELGRGTYAI